MQVSIEHRKLVDVTERICNRYCKWPTQSGSQEDLEEICDKCPLNTILCDDRRDDEDSDCPWQE